MDDNAGFQPREREGYKRGYVACSACRARKVRCVIGSEPPCARCKREHRECIFNNTEKTHKGRHPPKWAQPYESRETGIRPQPRGSTGNGDAARGQQQAGSIDAAPLPRNHALGGSQSQVSPANRSVTSMSDRMVSTVVTNSADAMNLLFNSAGPKEAQSTQADSHVLPQVTRAVEVVGFTITTLSDPDDDILDIWDKCRFVRQGWFTAQEAVSYIDLFHEKIAPLSAIDLSEFRPHTGHHKLVFEEAMLCCTILMISSRIFTLPGAGGVSRSHNVHRRLWNYCELLLKRVLLGQEKHSTAKIRVVGTIESLLLISDWPPRAVNFPPETEGFDANLISPDYDRSNRRQHDENAPLIRWREDVFEPANRVEKMTWMLLGVAVNLAHELQVFANELGSSTPSNDSRKWRLRKHLYICATQASLRMHTPSTLPDHIVQSATRTSSSSPYSPVDPQWTIFINLWIDLIKLSSTASAMFFQSAPHTRTQLLNGSYVPLLEHLLASMDAWHEKFMASDSCGLGALKISLLLEYFHLRACSAAIAVQAVVEKTAIANTASVPDGSTTAFALHTSPQDAKFLQGVANDAGEVLRLATLTDFKQHMPYVSTRLRSVVVSSSVFLLKAVSVGSRGADIDPLLSTLEQSARVLQQLAPDDMCFASRSAMLIEKQTAQLRKSLVPSRDLAQIPSAHHQTANLDECVHHGQQNFDEMGTLHATDNTASHHTFPGAMTMDGLEPMGMDAGVDMWMTLPYDYGMAPFGSDPEAMSFGFELDSLDFLWNLGH